MPTDRFRVAQNVLKDPGLPGWMLTASGLVLIRSRQRIVDGQRRHREAAGSSISAHRMGEQLGDWCRAVLISNSYGTSGR